MISRFSVANLHNYFGITLAVSTFFAIFATLNIVINLKTATNMRQSTKRMLQMLLATILMAGMSTTAQAQLGGLLKKAKQVATGVVEGKSASEIAAEQVQESQYDAIQRQQIEQRKAERAEKEKKAQDEAGQTGNLPEAKRGDVNFYYISGKRMGIWHPSTKTWEKFGLDANNKWSSVNYTIKNDGKVYYQDGVLKGMINDDGSMASVNTENIKVTKEGYVAWKNEQIGFINYIGEIWFMDDIMAYSDEPIDPKIAAYIFFCNTIDTKYIEEWKPKYEALKEQRAIERIKKNGPVTFGGSGGESGGGGKLSATDRWSLSGGYLSLNSERKVKIESSGSGWTIRDLSNAYICEVSSDGAVRSTSRGNMGSISSSGRCTQVGAGTTYEMDSSGTIRLHGGNVGSLTTGFNMAAAAYIFLVYAPQ